nr:unnamed protein product [Spirometra erinaceieuropaei]
MCSVVLRIPIIIINVFTLLVGACICAAGFYFRYNPNGLESILSTYISSSLSVSGTSSSNSQFTSDLISEITTLLGPVLLGIAYFGLAMMILSLIGLIAASCLIKILLIIYAILLGLLLLGQIVAIIVLATQKTNLINLMEEQLATYVPSYEGINGTNVASFIWNLIMSQAQCCGLNSGADFNGINMVVCCYLDGNKNLVDSTCAKQQTVVNSFYYTGCYTPLSVEFTSWINIIIICFAVGIAKTPGFDDDDDEEEEEEEEEEEDV